MLAVQPLPSQGIQSTSTAGEDIFVVFLYGVTHAMAMTVQASNTAYNLQSLDVPSIGALVSFCGWKPLRSGNATPLMVSHTLMWQDTVPTPTK
jgi:hypothetical protein